MGRQLGVHPKTPILVSHPSMQDTEHDVILVDSSLRLSTPLQASEEALLGGRGDSN